MVKEAKNREFQKNKHENCGKFCIGGPRYLTTTLV